MWARTILGALSGLWGAVTAALRAWERRVAEKAGRNEALLEAAEKERQLVRTQRRVQADVAREDRSGLRARLARWMRDAPREPD